MKNYTLFQGESQEQHRSFRVDSEALINMAGVILFYVIFFVAFNVFSG